MIIWTDVFINFDDGVVIIILLIAISSNCECDLVIIMLNHFCSIINVIIKIIIIHIIITIPLSIIIIKIIIYICYYQYYHNLFFKFYEICKCITQKVKNDKSYQICFLCMSSVFSRVLKNNKEQQRLQCDIAVTKKHLNTQQIITIQFAFSLFYSIRL